MFSLYTLLARRWLFLFPVRFFARLASLGISSCMHTTRNSSLYPKHFLGFNMSVLISSSSMNA